MPTSSAACASVEPRADPATPRTRDAVDDPDRDMAVAGLASKDPAAAVGLCRGPRRDRHAIWWLALPRAGITSLPDSRDRNGDSSPPDLPPLDAAVPECRRSPTEVVAAGRHPGRDRRVGAWRSGELRALRRPERGLLAIRPSRERACPSGGGSRAATRQRPSNSTHDGRVPLGLAGHHPRVAIRDDAVNDESGRIVMHGRSSRAIRRTGRSGRT